MKEKLDFSKFTSEEIENVISNKDNRFVIIDSSESTVPNNSNRYCYIVEQVGLGHYWSITSHKVNKLTPTIYLVEPVTPHVEIVYKSIGPSVSIVKDLFMDKKPNQ